MAADRDPSLAAIDRCLLRDGGDRVRRLLDRPPASSPGNVVAYVTSGLEVISRYSQAMATDKDPALHWIYIGYGFVALSVVAVAVAAWQLAGGRKRLAGAGLAALVALLLFAEWKTAFTREFPSYVFATFLIAAFAFASRSERSSGSRTSWGSRPVVGQSAVVDWLARGRHDCGHRARSRDLALSAQARRRAEIGTGLRGPGRRCGGARPVRTGGAADPHEPTRGPRPAARGVGGARRSDRPRRTVGRRPVVPRRRECPLGAPCRCSKPQRCGRLRRTSRNVTVLQRPGRAGRLSLAGNAVPREAAGLFIERQLGRPLAAGEQIPRAVDGRFRWFEEPATTLEIFCRYHQRISTARWQVLDRTTGSCGPPEPLSVVTAREGETVTVPVESRPGRFIIVRVHGIDPWAC